MRQIFPTSFRFSHTPHSSGGKLLSSSLDARRLLPSDSLPSGLRIEVLPPLPPEVDPVPPARCRASEAHVSRGRNLSLQEITLPERSHPQSRIEAADIAERVKVLRLPQPHAGFIVSVAPHDLEYQQTEARKGIERELQPLRVANADDLVGGFESVAVTASVTLGQARQR